MADKETLRHWREVHGVKRDIAKPFIDAGATYENAKPYIDADWGSPHAEDWASLGVPIETAQLWSVHKAISWNYRAWIGRGRNPDDVILWFDAGFTFGDCWTWWDYATNGDLRDRILSTADNAEILAVAIDHREQTGSTHPYWLACGFELDQIKRLAEVEQWHLPQRTRNDMIDVLKEKRATLDQVVDELIEWDRCRLYDADDYLRHNATVEQAKEWVALGYRGYDFRECHSITGELLPEKYDELVADKVVKLIRDLDGRIEHVNHGTREYPVDQMLETYANVRNDWAKAAILMAEVFDRIDKRIAARLSSEAGDVAAS